VSDSPFVEDNARELQRLRDLVARLSDDQLRLPVNEHWTVAAVLGHVAFWDARALFLADHFDPDTGFPDDVGEPENVDWINDSTRSLIHAIDPREVADLAVRTAEQIDARVAELPADKLWPNDPEGPLNGRRASHRAEHLDEIDAALG
jgi:Mycothiol maleylpyruvate isomerase N-terminal domain